MPLIFSTKADLRNLNIINTRRFSGDDDKISAMKFSLVVDSGDEKLLWEATKEIMFYVAQKFPVYDSE